jgi:hypothetical protein
MSIEHSAATHPACHMPISINLLTELAGRVGWRWLTNQLHSARHHCKEGHMRETLQKYAVWGRVERYKCELVHDPREW